MCRVVKEKNTVHNSDTLLPQFLTRKEDVNMECPNISKDIITDKFNTPVNYGNYVYYEHKDPVGEKTIVQFCKRIGRKKDVFECLNENEWRNCYAFKH